MVNYSTINCSSDRKELDEHLHRQFDKLFQYAKTVNVHVLYDIVSPTSSIGKYAFIFFIDIPNETGNYYRNKDKQYLSTLAIAVRQIYDTDITDCDDDSLYTEDGLWDYKKELETDRLALRKYIYENIPDVKYFDLSMVYWVKAPNCETRFINKQIVFNRVFVLRDVVDVSISNTLSGKDNYFYSKCLQYEDSEKRGDWSYLITEFIDIANEHTRQGILTKKKVDQITIKRITPVLEQARESIKNQLCVVRGKAGTGKTLALLKLMYEQVRNDEDSHGHRCRLLTFNNMLVSDLRMTLKNIGGYTPANASIGTLHQFFYDIYKKSPVRYLHMDSTKTNSIINTCLARVLKFNSLLNRLSQENEITDISSLLDVLDAEIGNNNDLISSDERKEYKDYKKYLQQKKTGPSEKLSEYAQQYVDYKKRVFEENYHRNEFLNGYNVILEELYLVFHNMDEFVEKYNFKISYPIDELKDSEQFKKRYQDLYNDFINNTIQKIQEEYDLGGTADDSFMRSLEQLDKEATSYYSNSSVDEVKEFISSGLKTIKRHVNWSKLILVDEAQDCLIYEKAILFELHGSDNIVIATGGHDQLIRSAQENDWTQLFGNKLLSETVTLRGVSYRQKGNIIRFLNSFAEEFNIETRLNVPDELQNYGKIIIDSRKTLGNELPIDIIDSLHMGGKDMGCSNYENMMFLFPKENYLKWNTPDDDSLDVQIDNNDTIVINKTPSERSLNVDLPDYLKVLDGTVNEKRTFLSNVGHDNTRCLLYESCRGLEAWNVMCVDLDTFYSEKITSKNAVEYAETIAGGLFEEGKDKYIKQYAALWCYMAMTRAIDTLYIKLSDLDSLFSMSLMKIANELSFVEVLND